MEYPLYGFDAEKHLATLVSGYVRQLEITGVTCSMREISLDAHGLLSIKPGYVWDFGSGPAIDTPSMVVASLTHDALYDLMKSGQLDKKYRKAADKEFLRALKDFGCGFFRRQYCYWAVRVVGGWYLGK